MARLRTACAVMLAAMLATACATTTQGTGSAASGIASSHRPDFPTRSVPASAAPTPSSSPPPTSTPTTAPEATAPPTGLAQRDAQLAARTAGESRLIVSVPGGLEAASYDTSGGIRFWRVGARQADWAQVGTSRYPAVVTGKPYRVAVDGTALAGMDDATFIVRGQFTEDGSGLAVAYTTGAHGWGAIKAESNGNIGPSGRPIGSDRIGLSRGFAFVGGQLQTADCPPHRPIAECGGHEIVKLWRWTGHDFTLAR